MIDQATIDRIMDAAQIVDVVSEFVTLRKRGVNYIGLCPLLRSAYRPAKEYANASVAEKEGTWCILSWSTNSFPIMRH